MLLSKIKVGTTVLLVVVAVGVGGDWLLLPTQSASGADEPSQLQAKQLQSPPQKDKPRIEVIGVRVHEFERQVLFVRDPSSGKFQLLTREDGIPVLKGHIGYHVQKLKDDKDYLRPMVSGNSPVEETAGRQISPLERLQREEHILTRTESELQKGIKSLRTQIADLTTGTIDLKS